ncbi:MAG: sulfotransferase family protein [Planctomycetota bacterium]
MSGTIVTLVTGIPRSGTSLLMQMVDAGGLPTWTDDHRPADEDNPHGYYELEAVTRTRRDSGWVARAEGRVVKIAHALLRDLPEHLQYRLLFARRELREVVRSQQAMLARLGRRGADLGAPELVAAYDRQMRELERWLDAEPRFRVLYVDYDATLADPAAAAAAVDDFLGGGLDRAAMASVVDPELSRRRTAR